MRRAAVVLGAMIVTAAVAGAAVAMADAGPTTSGAAPTPSVDTAALVAAVPHRAVAKIDPARLAPGVVPPTNRWYSGLVFGAEPQPVFAEPLSFALTATGFTLGLPDPVVSAKTIAAPHVPALTVDVGAASAQVTAADPVSVTVALLDAAGHPLGHVVLAEGSPFVSFTASTDVRARTTGATFSGDPATARAGSSHWGLAGGTTDGGTTSLAAGQSATWYALPPDVTDAGRAALADGARHAVTGVDVSYDVGPDTVRTTLTYRADGPTAYVLMPHQRSGDQPARDGCGLGTYPSVYGGLELCAGSSLVSDAPTLAPTGAFDLTGISDDERAAIRSAVTADAAATQPFPSDTYFGGKALYRAATLVVLGEQLGVDVAALRARTEAALREWTQPDGCTKRDARCVVYDEGARSAIGLTPSFGSDELNDHHFHYGYLLSAAGLLAAGHPSLAADLAPVMNLLGQDIAAATPSDQLPQLRSFDPYAGHSWASGTAPFADGNNQESSSEAVNAWNGLGLWARASGQDALATEATWLVSTESATARTYWTDPRLPTGFEHRIVSLNWGGKRDYATWFSADPAAILGIQLIPMGPVQRSVAHGVDPKQIRAAVREASPAGFDVQFGGYLLEYLALAGPEDAATAWAAARTLPDVAIDDGTSRAATLAFIASARAHPVG